MDVDAWATFIESASPIHQPGSVAAQLQGNGAAYHAYGVMGTPLALPQPVEIREDPTSGTCGQPHLPPGVAPVIGSARKVASVQKGADTWIIDSGATISLMNQVEALHEPTVFAEPKPIYLAIDAVGGTVATGAVCLSNGRECLWVYNAHCDPRATQNLLSMSRLVNQGCSFQTNEAGEPIAVMGPKG